MINYEKKIERMYPGYILKGSTEAHAELNRLKKEMEEAKENSKQTLEKYGPFHMSSLEAEAVKNDKIGY